MHGEHLWNSLYYLNIAVGVLLDDWTLASCDCLHQHFSAALNRNGEIIKDWLL